VSVFDTIAANAASSCNVGSSSVGGLSLISPSAMSAPDPSNGAAVHWRGFLRPSVFNTGAASSAFTASAGSSTTPQGKQQRVSAFNTAAVNTAFNTGADSGSSVLKDVSNTGARGRHLDKGKGKEIGDHTFDVGVDLGSTVNIGKGFGWAPDRTDDIGGSLSGGSGPEAQEVQRARQSVSLLGIPGGRSSFLRCAYSRPPSDRISSSPSRLDLIFYCAFAPLSSSFVYLRPRPGLIWGYANPNTSARRPSFSTTYTTRRSAAL
jgi:hypothetical protein